MAIRVRLRELLDQRHMTQTELQAQTRLAYSTINDLYNSKTRRVDLETLDVLCAALGCEVGDLLEYVQEKRPSRGARGAR